MIECNAYFQREDERKYLKEQNILMQACSPLAAGKEDLFTNEILCSIAQNHHKSVAQIVLRWLSFIALINFLDAGVGSFAYINPYGNV